MTQDDEKKFQLFETRVRMLIEKYGKLQRDNEDLTHMLSTQEERIKALEADLQAARQQTETVRMAKMLEVTSGDIDSARQRVARLIREVDKCIALVNV